MESISEEVQVLSKRWSSGIAQKIILLRQGKLR